MKIAFVDDDPKYTNYLLKTFTEVFHDNGIQIDCTDIFSNGEDFLNKWQFGAYDMIILDIFMSSLSGVDVARKIRQTDGDVKLIFCTTSNEFASESYSVGASYYLHKPIDRSDIKMMIQKINLTDYELTRFVTLPDGWKLILRNVIYTEYCNHVVLIHTKSGHDIEKRIAQSDFEKILCNSFLICCSKGIIANLYEVAKLESGIFLMKNNSRIPISRRKAKEVEDAYTDFMFYSMRKEMLE